MHDLPADLIARPFTVEQAAERGVSPKMLRGRRVRRVLPGVYVGADVPDSLPLRGAAALAAVPGGVLSHETAVAVHDLPLPLRSGTRDSSAIPLHVSVGGGLSRPRLSGITGHEAHWREGDVVQRRGLTVTSVQRTWCDLPNAGWGRDDLVMLADAILRGHGRQGHQLLTDRLAGWAGQRHARLLREALALSSFRVDSPMETRLRLLLHDAGLPMPVVNEPIRDVDGTPIHTPDLSWPQWRYALDYDGAHHFTYDHPADVAAGRRDDWRRRMDIGRQEAVREWGWVLTVVTSFDVLRDSAHLLRRVRTQLRDRGAPC